MRKRSTQDFKDAEALRELYVRSSRAQRAALLKDNPGFTAVAGQALPEVTYERARHLFRGEPGGLTSDAAVAWLQAQVKAHNLAQLRNAPPRAATYSWPEVIATTLAVNALKLGVVLAVLWECMPAPTFAMATLFALLYFGAQVSGALVTKTPR